MVRKTLVLNIYNDNNHSLYHITIAHLKSNSDISHYNSKTWVDFTQNLGLNQSVKLMDYILNILDKYGM